MVTIYSIAEKCQVSPATVSRALTRPELVSDALRQRILATADEMGYRANKNARRLARGVTGLVAIVVPDIRNPYSGPVLHALGRALENVDCSMLVVDTGAESDREIAAIRRLGQEVDGFIFIAPRTDLPALQTALSDARAVLLHRPGSTVDSVIVDEAESIGTAMEKLREMGHRKIAYLGGPEGSWMSARRRSLIEKAADDSQLSALSLHLESDDELDAHAVLESDATAVFCFDDALAWALIGSLREVGARVPEDISLIGFDDLLISRLAQPSLSSIGADLSVLATTTVELFTAATRGQLSGSSHHVGSTFRARDSIGAVRSR